MKRVYIFFLLIIALAFIFLIQAAPVIAESKFIEGLKTTAEDGAGYPSSAAENPSGFISKLLGSALTPIFLGVSGMLAMAYGGYKWMMAQGNEQEVELAKNIIINTLIALVVAFSAWAIVKLIIPLWKFVAV